MLLKQLACMGAREGLNEGPTFFGTSARLRPLLARRITHLVGTAASTRTGPMRSLDLNEAYASMNARSGIAYRPAEAAKLNDGDSLTFISGFGSHRPIPKAILQGALNAAIEGLVRGLALELAPLRGNASNRDSSTRSFLPLCRPIRKPTFSPRPRGSCQSTASAR